MTIIALVEHLAQRQLSYDTSIWGNWQIQPVPSGNNRLFRATSPDYDVVVKFLIRDDRHRAEREWSALTLLQSLNMPLGPRPVYCDRDRLPYAVVVQTWLDGQTISAPSLDPATWLQILQAYARLHQISPTDIARHAIVFPQIVGISGPEAEAKEALYKFAQRVPLSKHSVELAHLLQRVDRLRLPSFSVTPCWCHGDANIRNILQTPQGIQFVDWEYTCYSDPAAEIALLMTHPLAQAASDAHWHWMAEQYAQLSGEVDMEERIRVQYALRLVWWYIRLLIGHYVLLAQPTHRLAGSGAEEEISTLQNIDHYGTRAHSWLNQLL